MLIDWFTVAAQALNFLILVWLLKRFLYQPVLDAIAAREQRIAMQLADAAAKVAAAGQEREDFERRNAQFDAERAALLARASGEAKAELQRLLEQARGEADALRARLANAWRSEQQTLNGEITRRTRDEVLAIARQVLSDLATARLQDSIVQVFIERIHQLSAADRTLLAAAIGAPPGAVPGTTSGAAIVRSAFELPAAQRAAIERAVEEICGAAARLGYETAPDLIAGVELSAGGRKLAWSIADYLSVLEKRVGEILGPQLAVSTAQR